MTEKVLVYYLLLVNLVSIGVTISDKQKAIRHESRISEKTLFMLSLAGGSLVMLITMIFIRHKTRHLRFMAGLPAILVFQLVTAGWILGI